MKNNIMNGTPENYGTEDIGKKPRRSRKAAVKEVTEPTKEVVEPVKETVEVEETSPESKVEEHFTDDPHQGESGYYDERGNWVKANPLDSIAERYENDGIPWRVDDREPAPFDYGYRTTEMTDENLQYDEKSLFLNRKMRSSDMTFQMVLGSVRSIGDAAEANPSEYFVMDDEEVAENGYDSINPHRAYWKSMGWLALSQYNHFYDGYRHLMNDTSVRWRQGWALPNGKLRGLRSRPVGLNNGNISESTAVDVLNAALNIGKDIDLFLPHSGFSVVLKAPLLAQFVELERKIIGDRLSLFRNPKGLLMSHDMSMIHQAIFDMFVSCVKSTSVGTIDREFLMENISYLDINDIAWALACAKYPNGFVAILSCLANPGTCNHVTNEAIDPRKMYFCNHDRLNPFQQEMAARLRGETTVEEIATYLDSFDYGEDGYCDIRTLGSDMKVRVYFALPSIGHVFRSAETLRMSLEHAANEAFATPLVGDERADFMEKRIESYAAMKYEPYVLSIGVIDEDGVEVKIEDQANIRGVLIGISENPLQLMDFNVGVEKFINRATVSLVGLPNMKCPSCGGYHETDYENGAGKFLIPLDVTSFFTILCRQLVMSLASNLEEAGNNTTAENALSP